MLGNAWITLRQAQEALKRGRLEEAHRLLGQSAAQGHQRSWELLQQVAQGFIERGKKYLAQEDEEAAWNDLLLAEQVGIQGDAGDSLRQVLTRMGMEEVRARFSSGLPGQAMESIELLRQRAVRLRELQSLEEAAKDWLQAQYLADRGDFPGAIRVLDRVRIQLPGLPSLERFAQDLAERGQALAPLLLKLHEAVDEGHLRQVVEVADQVLAIAPQQGEARKARAKAWQVIEPPTIAVPSTRKGTEDTGTEASERFLLWIDGVGGYLVCMDARVTIGQATPDAVVDIPLFADVSRLHATLVRDGEGYLVEANRPVQVNGKPTEKLLLQSGDRLTLGTSCQLQFRQPVPVSASARLDLTSGHKLALSVDAVLLMADTLVLGPGTQVHVNMPDIRQPVILYRQRDGLGVRCSGKLVVDGQPVKERGILEPRSKVSGEEFAFSLEPVGKRLK